MKRKLLLTLAVALFSAVLIAGGPWVVDEQTNSGVPARWTDNKILWFSDAGPLSTTVTNDTAVPWMIAAFEKWVATTLRNSEGVSESPVNVTVEYGGSVGYDITVDNYGEFWNEASGPTVVIFDATGEILEQIYGVPNVLGLTNDPVLDDSGIYIVKNTAIISGKVLDDSIITEEQIRAVMTHEAGHLLNLDHSVVNHDLAAECSISEDPCANATVIPTMYPQIKSYVQQNPIDDDIISLGFIYPRDWFTSNFCTIRGRILNQDNCPVQGVHVVAFRVGEGDAEARADARGMVSGILYPACYGNGDYYLAGIIPGKTYKVFYEPVPYFSGASGVEPLGEDSPSGFESAYITRNGDEVLISCDDAGGYITMDDVNFELESYICDYTNCEEVAPSSSGCHLVAH